MPNLVETEHSAFAATAVPQPSTAVALGAGPLKAGV